MFIRALKEFSTILNDFQSGQVAEVSDDIAAQAIADGNAVASSIDELIEQMERRESGPIERAVAKPMQRVEKRA